MDRLKSLFEILPAPPRGRSPALACLIGLLSGGIGLSIYLRNVVDLVMPLALLVVAVAQLGDIGVVGAALLVSLYGYLRVQLGMQTGSATAMPGPPSAGSPRQ